jgi:hypothetical protein
MTTRLTRIIRFFMELDSFHLLDCLGNLIGITCVTSFAMSLNLDFVYNLFLDLAI